MLSGKLPCTGVLQMHVSNGNSCCTVICFILCRPKDWYPMMYYPVFNTYGEGDLEFHIGLMNGGFKHDLPINFQRDSCNITFFFFSPLFTHVADFSGPATSTSFPLGSLIPIMASVVQKSHQPLLLLLEECIATSTPELHPKSSIYPIITNKG